MHKSCSAVYTYTGAPLTATARVCVEIVKLEEPNVRVARVSRRWATVWTLCWQSRKSLATITTTLRVDWPTAVAEEGFDSVPCVWFGLVVATAPLALGVGMHGCARSLTSVARHA